jgi:hypothetical protein
MIFHQFALICLSGAAFALAGSDPQARPPADDATMETWWLDLEKGEAEATRALLKFSAQPKASVTFLAKRVKPLKIDADQIRSLLEMLKSDKEEVWKKAFEHMEYFDPRLAIDLETLMGEVRDSPTRQRMVEVLSGRAAGQLEGKQIELRGVGEGFNFMATPNFGSWWAEHKIDRLNSSGWGNPKKKWTRAVRVIVLLEHIKTAEAVAILTDMTTGHPEAEPTRMAREALDRISGKIK